ncbi:ferredoxin [Streptomyces sp. NPDC047841]|uniref:ferredoxin n=1 Tax=Streptomyces sp. NPDC047841 TaxID=3154708 RepID=UPI0034545C8D
MTTVTVDTARCIAGGQCARLVPDVFDQDQDDGTSVLLRPEVPAARLAAVQEAVALCPGAAIHLRTSP